MEFFITKIVDQEVDSKIDLERVNELLLSLELPSSFNDFDKVIITLVAREPNDFEPDSWERDDSMYYVIPLDYEGVLDVDEEEVLDVCMGEIRERLGVEEQDD